MKRLTIVIPSKNEGKTLIKCLSLLELQTENFDIIIADSSDIQDIELHEYVKEKFHIRIIDGGLPSVARNKGFDLVQTPYVLFLDADIMLYDTKILETCIQRMNEYELISCVYKCDDNKYNYVWKFYHIIQKIMSETFVVGGFQLWNVQKFKEYGKFDINIKVAEDWMLSRKVKKHKHKLIDRYIYTSGRRFKNKGVMWMLYLMLNSWINRNNIKWFYKSHNYWS